MHSSLNSSIVAGSSKHLDYISLKNGAKLPLVSYWHHNTIKNENGENETQLNITFSHLETPTEVMVEKKRINAYGIFGTITTENGYLPTYIDPIVESTQEQTSAKIPGILETKNIEGVYSYELITSTIVNECILKDIPVTYCREIYANGDTYEYIPQVYSYYSHFYYSYGVESLFKINVHPAVCVIYIGKQEGKSLFYKGLVSKEAILCADGFYYTNLGLIGQYYLMDKSNPKKEEEEKIFELVPPQDERLRKKVEWIKVKGNAFPQKISPKENIKPINQFNVLQDLDENKEVFDEEENKKECSKKVKKHRKKIKPIFSLGNHILSKTNSPFPYLHVWDVNTAFLYLNSYHVLNVFLSRDKNGDVIYECPDLCAGYSIETDKNKVPFIQNKNIKNEYYYQFFSAEGLREQYFVGELDKNNFFSKGKIYLTKDKKLLLDINKINYIDNNHTQLIFKNEDKELIITCENTTFNLSGDQFLELYLFYKNTIFYDLKFNALNEAVVRGSVEALLELGDFYFDRIDTLENINTQRNRNYKNLSKLNFMKAQKNNHKQASFRMKIWNLLFNPSMEINKKLILNELEEKAENGDVFSQNMLSKKSFFEHCTDETIFCRVQKAAENGYLAAIYNLGFLYFHGIVFDKDKELGVSLFKKAADAGHMESQFDMGYLYQYGIYLKEDRDLAVKYFTLAADQGYNKAQFNLASIFYEENNLDKAILYYKMAAEQGDETAQFNLAILYLDLKDDAKALKESIYYLQKLSDKGHPLAQNQMGNFYLQGKGVDQDYKTAANYFRKSADQGCALAQISLEFLCERNELLV